MIYVYRPSASASARELAEIVDGIRSKNGDRLRGRVRNTDKVVMWGAYLPNIPGLVLNNTPLRNKFEDAVRLREAGIRTVEVARTRPVTQPAPPPVDPLGSIWGDAQNAAEDFVQLELTRDPIARQGISELVQKLNATIAAMQRPAPVAPPPQVVGEWLGRTFDHVGGNDLLHPTRADYYSKKETFVNEYRVHSFFGRSIRAGKKVPRTPQSETPFTGTPHAWIRSFEAGWQISYADDFAASNKKQKIRDIAHAAVKALGLEFGAVDIGELADGTLVVLEVNRAPGIEQGTTAAYGRAIRKWIHNEWAPDGAEVTTQRAN
jgi:hypothetical protein